MSLEGPNISWSIYSY